MYNPQVVNELLKRRNLSNADLLRHLGLSPRTNLNSQLNADIRVSKLEKIADFFGVPTDTFFNRTSTGNHVGFSGENQRFRDINIQQDSQCKNLLALIEEKNKRIDLLEEMVNLYKNRDSVNNGISGQNQDNNK